MLIDYLVKSLVKYQYCGLSVSIFFNPLKYNGYCMCHWSDHRMWSQDVVVNLCNQPK